MLQKQTKVIAAAHPRTSDWSTASGTEQLELVYNEYFDDSVKSKVPARDRLNLYFFHGTGHGKEIWEVLIELFFAKLGPALGAVVAMDCVNHGDSYGRNKDKLGWAFPWIDTSHDITHLIRTVNAPGTNIIIGHSMGASQALYAAFLDPAIIDSVVAFDPVLASTDAPMFDPKVRDAFQDKMRKVGGILFDEFPNEAAYDKFLATNPVFRQFDKRVVAKIHDSYVYKDGEKVIYKTPKHAQLDCYYNGQYLMRDGTRILEQLDCEVLYVFGTKSNFYGVQDINDTRKRLRFCTPVDIEGGSHHVAFDWPEKTMDSGLLAFVQKRHKRSLEREREMDERAKLSPEQLQDYVDKKYKKIYSEFPGQPLYAKL